MIDRVLRHGFLAFFLLIGGGLTAQLYVGEQQRVAFTSDAPLELIEAASGELRAAVRADDRNFAFRVRIVTFEGFNGRLQQQHFNENYLESHRFPEATFQGRIIEREDLTVPGIYEVRAKGKLIIHGIAQERIIRARVESTGGELRIVCLFAVPLADHNIDVPRIVHQKIASEIMVRVEAVLERRED